MRGELSNQLFPKHFQVLLYTLACVFVLRRIAKLEHEESLLSRTLCLVGRRLHVGEIRESLSASLCVTDQ